MMFAVAFGLAVRVTMSAEQRQQLPFTVVDRGVGATLMRRLERLGKVKGKMHRHQRVEGEREEAEPCGPDRAPPLPRSHSGAPAFGDVGAERF
jgi:hypothetical protein